MNRIRTALVFALLACQGRLAAGDIFSSYFNRRFDAPRMEVREIEGLEKRIQDGKLHVRLRDFLTLVLKNSADIQITRMDVYTAADQIVSAKAPFDPTIGAGFNTLRSLSPFYSEGGFGTTGTTTGTTSGTTTFGGGTTNSAIALPETLNSLTQSSSLNYTQLLPTGQSINTTFGVTRSSGDGYTSPALFGSLNFTITQPLIQNRTNIQNRAPITIARTNLVITSEQSEATIGNAVAAAAQQYWEAILARDGIRVQEQTLALAQKSYERDKKALDLGALAKLDIYQSETQVADRTRGLVQARYVYKASLDGLRRLIGADLTAALRATEIVLEDEAVEIPPESAVLPFEEALSKALQARPEAKAIDNRISVDNLSARVARDQLLPRLDLSLQGGATGPGFNQLTAGSTLGIPANAPYPGLGDTLSQVLKFNYPSYGFGLQLTFPFRNSTAQASLADSLVDKARTRYTQRQTQEQIILDVRQAINSIELAKASIEAATRARDLAQKNVEAEQQKYELGSNTVFEVLSSQTSLSATQSTLVNAYVAYQEAYISYQRATWTLLDGLGMVVDVPKVR